MRPDLKASRTGRARLRGAFVVCEHPPTTPRRRRAPRLGRVRAGAAQAGSLRRFGAG
jgi:hypothetical protein